MQLRHLGRTVRLRENRTIISAIGASTECESRWDEKLSEIVWGNESLRESEHWILPSATCSHTVVVLWRTSQVVHRNQLWCKEGASSQDKLQPVEACQEKAAENLTKVRRAMKERKVATEYQVGDLVLWRDAST